jgi:hypothetical protein
MRCLAAIDPDQLDRKPRPSGAGEHGCGHAGVVALLLTMLELVVGQ